MRSKLHPNIPSKQQVGATHVFEWFYPRRTGWLAWILQRITGAVIAVYLFFHVYILHFITKGALEYNAVMARLTEPAWFVFDSTLLAIGLYHGLNGIRVMLFDLGIGLRHQKAVFWGFLAAGVLVFIVGIYILASVFFAPA